MKTDMRANLLALMQAAGDDAYSLAEKSGVPQPTTQRFLSGKHGDPKSLTVQKWARAYGVSESQLRGDLPFGETMVAERKVDYLAMQPQPGEDYELFARMLALQAGLLAVIRTAPYNPNLPPVLAQELARARDIMAANPIDEGSLDAFDNQAEAIRIAADIHHS